MEEGLSDLIKRGGIYRNLKGVNPRDVLAALINALPAGMPVPSDVLLEAVLEREALMPTGICRGIALPHPRNPLLSRENEQFIALAFPEQPVDWNSLDGEKVHTLMLIVSSSAKLHLNTLSKINFLCRQEDFYRLLKERADLDALLNCVSETEKKWK